MRTRRQVKESLGDEAEALAPAANRTPAAKKSKPASAGPTTRSPKQKAELTPEPSSAEIPVSSKKPLRQTPRRNAGGRTPAAPEVVQPVAAEEEDAADLAAEAVDQDNAAPITEAAAAPGLQAGQESEDDDAAPEEVSLGTAKQAAQQQQKAENRAEAELRKAAKEKTRRRAQQMAEEKLQSRRRKQTAAQTSTPASELQEAVTAFETGRSDAAANTLPQDADADTLPAEVIAALEQQARTTAQLEQKNKEQQAAERARLKRKRQNLTERQDGPVTVKLLDEKPAFAPSSAAVEFMRQRLYGDRLKRSADMLRPVRAGGQPVFCPASNFGGRQ